MRRFDEMAVIINDRIDDPAEADVEYYVGLEHLDSESLSIRRWGSPSDVEATKLRFRTGDIIFGRRRAYQRKLAVAPFDGICSAHAMVLRAKPEVALPEFLPFFMQSDLFMERAKEISVGSLSPTINWRTLAGEEFALPPLAEQKRMADVLGVVEKLGSSFDATNDAIERVIRSLSSEQFLVRESDEVALADHYSIVTGQVDPRRPELAGLPLIGPNHIESRTGRLLELASAEQQAAISGKYMFEEGAVLYSKIRPNLIKAAIAPCRGLCSADVYALMPKATLHPEYLLGILLSDRFTQFAVAGSMRTGIPKVNREYLTQYRCRLPSLREQDRYLGVVHGLHSARETVSLRQTALTDAKRQMLDGIGRAI